MTEILGVILCGGESKRMGSDKGLSPVQHTIWAKYMADKLAFLELPVVYAINENQFKNYSGYISPDQLITDDTDLKGPASGLLTVHKRFPAHDLLLLACDMLELDEFTIRNILQAYYLENTYDYYVYQDEDYAQPFCGIYTGRGIDALQDHIRQHSLTNISMQHVLNNGNTKRISIEHKKAFTNFNFKSNEAGD